MRISAGWYKPFTSKKLAKSTGQKIIGKDNKPHLAWEIELFGTGKQLVLPPSIYSITRERYHWERKFRLDAKLPYIPSEVIEDIIGYEEDSVEHDVEPLGIDLEETKEALDTLLQHDRNYWCDEYEGWRNIGMALSHEYGGTNNSEAAFDLWCKFSENAPEKFDRDKQRKFWNSFKGRTDRPITIRSVLKQAATAQRELEHGLLPGEFDDLPTDEELAYHQELKSLFEDFDDLDNPPEIKAPKHLQTIPGVLGHGVEYASATAVKPQRQFDVQTVLAIGSVVLGRNYRTDLNNYASLFFLNIGPTASGKEHANRVINRVLDKAHLGALIGPKSYSSEAGLISALARKPKHITIVDETGRYLSTGREAKNSLMKEVQTALMEAIGHPDGVARSTGYSARGKTQEQIKADEKVIVRPAITFLGMTTPSTFYAALGGADVKDGFLNRFIIIETDLGRQLEREDFNPDVPVPQALVDWAKEHAYAHSGGEDDDIRAMDPNSDFVPEPVVVPFAKECRPILREMSIRVNAEMKRLDEYGMAELYGRTREHAMRLSLIVAVSCGSKVVKPEHLTWARDYVFYYQSKMAEQFKSNLGKTEREVIADEVLAFLKKRGTAGASERDIAKHVRSFRPLESKGRLDVFARLQTDSDVKHAMSDNVKGRKTKVYFAPSK
jgi:hypothetical protein